MILMENNIENTNRQISVVDRMIDRWKVKKKQLEIRKLNQQNPLGKLPK